MKHIRTFLRKKKKKFKNIIYHSPNPTRTHAHPTSLISERLQLPRDKDNWKQKWRAKSKNFISKQNTGSLSLSLSLSLCLSLRVRVRVREKNGDASCGGASTDEDGVAAIDVRKRDTDPPAEDRLLCVVVSQFPPIHQVQSSTNRPKPRFASRWCAFFLFFFVSVFPPHFCKIRVLIFLGLRLCELRSN